MASKAKLKNLKSPPSKIDAKIHKYLIALPIIALSIKLLVMSNIFGGAWYGADGENYMYGVDGLLKEGFFSDEPKLSYWPAGYPILLWPLAAITTSKIFYLLSIIQSFFYAFSTYYLTSVLRNSSFKRFALISSFLISFNPTLTLSSLAVGYEGPIASCFMMVVALTIKYHTAARGRYFWFVVTQIALWFALAIFMQPRYLLVAAIYLIYWVIKLGEVKRALAILALSGTVVSVGPALMIYRNINVINEAKISTNLGATMAIGAGETTSGGYARSGPEVPCGTPKSKETTTDSELVICVSKWYLTHPVRALQLAYNKSQFFWSPWSGPLQNGTSARNPWLKISPVQSMYKNQDSADLLNGWVGKSLSYGWILGQLILLMWGYRELTRIGFVEKTLATLIMIPIVVSWLIAIGTIGDNRFRLPTMSLSLLIQGAGLIAIKAKVSKGL
jgi:hypothetical protein